MCVPVCTYCQAEHLHCQLDYACSLLSASLRFFSFDGFTNLSYVFQLSLLQFDMMSIEKKIRREKEICFFLSILNYDSRVK